LIGPGHRLALLCAGALAGACGGDADGPGDTTECVTAVDNGDGTATLHLPGGRTYRIGEAPEPGPQGPPGPQGERGPPTDRICRAPADLSTCLVDLGGEDLVVSTPVDLGTDAGEVIVPADVTLVFSRGGSIRVPGGAALNIEGGIHSAAHAIFTGEGTVALGRRVAAVRPEWFGARADGATDDTRAIQAAIDGTVAGGSVSFARGDYLITQTIRSRGRSLRGADPRETRFSIPSGVDVTAFEITGARVTIENLSVWFHGQHGPGAVGMAFASADEQFARSIVRSVFIRNAYIGFGVVDHGPDAPRGTLWLNRFTNCHADHYLMHGWHFDSRVGSTTQAFEGCFAVRHPVSGEDGGVGMYFRNFDELSFDNVALDGSQDRGLHVEIAASVRIGHLALEASRLTTPGAQLVYLNAPSVVEAITFKATDIQTLVGDAHLVGIGARGRLVIGQLSELHTSESASGRLGKLRIGAPTPVNVLDATVTPADVSANGWDQVISYGAGSRRLSPAAPLPGLDRRGSVVWSSAPQPGGVVGWTCVATGEDGGCDDWKGFGRIEP